MMLLAACTDSVRCRLCCVVVFLLVLVSRKVCRVKLVGLLGCLVMQWLTKVRPTV